LLPLIAEAQQNLSDEALDKRLDEIIEVMADDPDQAWSELEVIREVCKDAGDRELWADWNIVAGFAQQAMGNLDTAEQYVEESITLYRANKSDEGVLSALLVRGELFIAMGRYREGIQDLEEVLTSSADMKTEEPEDVEYYAAAAHKSLGEAYTILGDFAAALEHIQATYRIYEGLEDEMGLSVTVGMLGNLYVDLDAAEKALEMYREGVRVDRQRGDEINVAINLYNIGRALTDLGNHDEARQHYAESLEISNRIGNQSTIGYI
jgi:tetratricopeptide (TPR) repeat protein